MAVETLRPNGVGNKTELTPIPGTGEENWEDVDETPAEDTDYVQEPDETIERADVYALPNSGVGAGVINKVTVFFRCYCLGDYLAGHAKAHIRCNGNYYSGDDEAMIDDAWHNFNYIWAQNPATGPAAWIWADINALEAGVALTAGETTSIAEGVLILALNGHKPVEEVKIGESLVTFDPYGRIFGSSVVSSIVNRLAETIIINETLMVTPNHRVWVNGAFAEAVTVKTGDIFLDEKGKAVCVYSLVPGPRVRVYSIELGSAPHTLFAGGYLVHNAILDAPTKCSQVYVEVDYTPSAEEEPKHTFRLDPKPRGRMRFYPNLKLG